MVTFAKRLRPSTKFEVTRPSRSKDTAHIQCVSCLSTTVSQLFEPQLQKNHFYVPRPLFFCLPWGRPFGNHAKRCMNEKTIQCLPNPSQHVPIYLQQFPMLKSMRKSKYRYFYHISVSPGDAPGAITLNVVWMEREPFLRYSEILVENRQFFILSLHSTPPLGGFPLEQLHPTPYAQHRTAKNHSTPRRLHPRDFVKCNAESHAVLLHLLQLSTYAHFYCLGVAQDSQR